MKRFYTIFVGNRAIYHGKDEEGVKAFIARQGNEPVRIEISMEYSIDEPHEAACSLAHRSWPGATAA